MACAWLVLVVTVAAQPPKTSPGRPAGLVVGMRGRVELDRGGAKAPAAEGGLLRPGDRLTAAEKGELTVLLLGDGRRVRLKPGRAAALGEKGFEPADAVEEVAGP